MLGLVKELGASPTTPKETGLQLVKILVDILKLGGGVCLLTFNDTCLLKKNLLSSCDLLHHPDCMLLRGCMYRLAWLPAMSLLSFLSTREEAAGEHAQRVASWLSLIFEARLVVKSCNIAQSQYRY